MNLEIEYKDREGVIHNLNFNMPLTAFLKHAAFSGYYSVSFFRRMEKATGIYLTFKDYLDKETFSNNKFSTPSIDICEPTEKAHFSNIVGKAIADFLSKKIDNSLYTVNYEAAMRVSGYSLSGSRPDLLAFANIERFALEAKGYKKINVSDDDMHKHKLQSQEGPIPVDFTVASVSYGLYSRVKCKYHDPVQANNKNDEDLLRKLTKSYYSDIHSFYLEHKKESKSYSIQNEEFIEVKLNDELGLIIPKDIEEYAKTGLNKNTNPFMFYVQDREDFYIDRDRIGLIVYNLK
ncbi:hypothetical protein [Dysgonomonas capnocytophagoides]|uniref:hypothetical protein n=1 Tax=Dysgonomonas capnocytophagoides TaxID=45254 RepID=UPI0029238412|nr:hypothetical protein DCPSUM001_01390 [Dysgonomonas capnocytophagoides]